MTVLNIQQLKNRELEAAVAKHFMNLPHVRMDDYGGWIWGDNHIGYGYSVDWYTSNMLTVMPVLEKLKLLGVRLGYGGSTIREARGKWSVTIINQGKIWIEDELPEAICKAALYSTI